MKRDLPPSALTPPASITVNTRAIDVGYANTKFTLGRKMVNNQPVIATDLFYSIAAAIPRSRRLEHSGANGIDGCLTNIGGAQYFAGKGVEMHLKGSQARHVLPGFSTTPDYLALMHGAMHYMAADVGNPRELVIEHLALGLPLNTFAEYQERLVELATGTHHIGSIDGSVGPRTVHVLNAYVMMQPFGALANLGLTTGLSLEGWNLVIDVGGGTVDYLVALDREPNFARSGAHPESMLQCAYEIAKEIKPEYVNNFNIVQHLEEAIRVNAETFTIAGVTYEMEAYKPHIDAVLSRAYQAMLANVGDLSDFAHILICGGGGPAFYEFLADNAPADLKRRIKMDAGSVYSNVRGFHIACEHLSTVCAASAEREGGI